MRRKLQRFLFTSKRSCITGQNLGAPARLLSCLVILLAALLAINSQAASEQKMPEAHEDLAEHVAELKFKSIAHPAIEEIGEIWDIEEDAHGYMWFAGSDGVGRYDGHNLKIFRHAANNPASLSSNFIMDMLIDSQGRHWFATQYGLNLYDPEREQFSKIDLGNAQLNNSALFRLAESRTGDSVELWLGFEGVGLAHFNPQTGELRHYPQDINQDGKLSHTSALHFLEEPDGKLWVGTYRGLNLFDPASGHFTSYLNSDADPASLSENRIQELFKDSAGDLWIGTMNGLNRFNYQHKNFERFYHEPDNPSSLAGNVVRSIVEDRAGKVWVATDGGGLSMYDRKNNRYINLEAKSETAGNLQSNNLRKIFVSQRDELWVGYYPFGISVKNKYASQIVLYQHKKYDNNSLSHSTVNALSMAADGGLWVGTENGLNHINLVSGRITRQSDVLTKEDSLGLNPVTALLLDSEKNLWVGTWEGGLYRYDSQAKLLRHYSKRQGDDSALPSNQIWSLHEDNARDIWVGTEWSLVKYLRAFDSFTFRKYFFDAAVDVDGYSGVVWSIAQFSADQIWVSSDNSMIINSTTDEVVRLKKLGPFNDVARRFYGFIKTDEHMFIATSNGVLKVSSDFSKKKRILKADGLTDGSVFSVVKDLDGDLWFAADSGLFRYREKHDSEVGYEITNFRTEHGFPSNSYSRVASLVLPDGRIAQGSSAGLALFHPRELYEADFVPRPILTGLKVLNRSIEASDGRSPINKSIAWADSITLNYDQNMFAIEYGAIEFQLPEKTQFAYRLEGFDQQWIHVANQRTATYTNLDPGSYIFQVKASNDRGVWSEPKSIRVTIIPPWWRSWWAYVIYALVFCSVLAIALAWIYARQQARREKMLNSKLKEIDHLKNEFLANTSHEFRTPLHAIIGLTDSILHNTALALPAQVTDSLQLIKSSSRRLSALINDILDFSKLRNNSIELSLEEVNLQEIAGQVIALTAPLIKEKQLRLENHIPVNFPAFQADKNRLVQILLNLLGNAIKFTHEGSIRLSAQRVGDEVHISVIDTGMGIPSEKLEKIFNNFEQVDGSIERSYGGSGLGLAITKKLVELHGGKISAKSVLQRGSEFVFSLPLNAAWDSIGENKISAEMSSNFDPLDVIPVNRASSEPELENEQPTASAKGDQTDFNSEFRILVVDDVEANREVLIHALALKQYQVSVCQDGEEVLALLQRPQQLDEFDLILLDVMMPRVSGYTVCTEIRKVYARQELPIIFLTAKDREEDIEKGFELGGNDYIRKPFSISELFARIEVYVSLLNFTRHQEQLIRERTRLLEQKTIFLEEKSAELEKSNNHLTQSRQNLIQTQAQLVQAEKMSSLGILVAGIGHEINNPLSYINISAYELTQEMQDFHNYLLSLIPDDADEQIALSIDERITGINTLLASIEDGINRVNAVVGSLKNYSRVDRDNPVTERILPGLESTINLVKAKYGADVRFETELTADIAVKCRLSELNQVFMNLLVNACQAMIEREDLAPVPMLHRLTIRTWETDQRVGIVVEDNGPGIPQELQKSIFDPFFTTKSRGRGTGLGLSISWEIVRKYGGEIHLESSVGSGATFTVEFPKADEEPLGMDGR